MIRRVTYVTLAGLEGGADKIAVHRFHRHPTRNDRGQKSALRVLLASHSGVVLHNGDAVGADAEAHDIAVELDFGVVIHPPDNVTQRAFKIAWLTRGPRPYLDRIKAIVRETSFLIAAPAMEIKQLRSGTWSTVRYARRQGGGSSSGAMRVSHLRRYAR